MIRLIVAMDENRGVADERGIPWQGRIPTDAKYFRDQTAHGIIVMGYRTYAEFPEPLHDRPNYVVMRPGPPLRPRFEATGDVEGFLRQRAGDELWVIGGAGLFARSIGFAHELYTTRVEAEFHCTKFFPEFEDDFVLVSERGPCSDDDISFRFEVWQRKNVGSPLVPSSGSLSRAAGTQRGGAS